MLNNNKTYVLDTNVLLNDPKAFLSLGENATVVLPYQVLIELERQKLQRDTSVGASAREVARHLNSILGSHKEQTLKTGIILENGNTLRAISSLTDFSDILEKIKSPEELKNKADDDILAVCIGLKEREGQDVILVSEDLLLKIRANSFGINNMSFKKDGPIVETTNTDNTNNDDENDSGYHHLNFPSESLMAKFWEGQARQDEYLDEAGQTELEELIKVNSLNNRIHYNEFLILNYDQQNPKKKPFAVLRHVEGKKGFKFVYEQKLSKLKALNLEQTLAMDLLMDPKIKLVNLVGCAGTGKSLIGLGTALEQVFAKQYKTLVILRPIQPLGRDVGYIKGELSDKLSVYLGPIHDNLKFLLSDNSKKAGQTLDHLIDRGIIEIEAMTFIRGRSISNAIILLDEFQNVNQHELKAVLTRVGHGTKVILTGDVEQIDRADVNQHSNGLAVAMEKFRKYGISGNIVLNETVRSELAKIAAKVL